MSKPSFGVDLARLQEHCKLLINQPLTEFQEKHNITITSIDIDFIDLSSRVEQIRQIRNFKITIIPK